MRYWIFWLIAGVMAVIGGIVALANPFAASIAAVALTGWLFLLIGILQIAGVVLEGDWHGRLWSLVIGALGLGLGIWLLLHPGEGLLPLTYVVGWVFLLFGLARIVIAWPLRDGPFFWPLLLSGFLSAILGMMILADFHTASLMVLGILLAIEMISGGISAIALAFALRHLR